MVAGVRTFAALTVSVLAIWLALANSLAADPDYNAARWHPIHFKPAIETATDEQCLACHRDVLERRPLRATPAGVPASAVRAWYQTLDTYAGEQETLHRRHIVTPLAQDLMRLRCNFCHQGNDPREEAPGASATGPAVGTDAGFTLRKVVDTEATCLLCHGRFDYEVMEGVEGPWHEVRQDFESEDMPNGCLVCHEELFRTVRHQVNYLNAAAIERSARTSGDQCFGCHGGRAWFRISYPYPRHPWPDMPEETPEWAKDRPTKSKPRHRAEVK